MDGYLRRCMNFYKELTNHTDKSTYIKNVIDDGKCYLVSMPISEYYRILYNIPKNRFSEMIVIDKKTETYIVFLVDVTGKIKTLKQSADENDYVKYMELESIGFKGGVDMKVTMEELEYTSIGDPFRFDSGICTPIGSRYITIQKKENSNDVIIIDIFTGARIKLSFPVPVKDDKSKNSKVLEEMYKSLYKK